MTPKIAAARHVVILRCFARGGQSLLLNPQYLLVLDLPDNFRRLLSRLSVVGRARLRRSLVR